MEPATLTAEEVNRHVKVYLGVFASLLVLTGLTVGIAFIDLGHEINIVFALLIATAKASLVGLFFMHLKWERKSIYSLLVLVFFFFLALIGLTLGGYWDTTRGAEHHLVAVEIPLIAEHPGETH